MTAVIRRATLEDVPGIARVHVDSWRTSYRGIVPDEILANLSVEQREQLWQSALARLDQNFLHVAEDEAGQIVGFISGGAEREGAADYSGELYAIYLLQEAQRGGIGRRLAEALVRDLLQHGHQSMLVWVLKDNVPGRRFYEKLGGQYVSEKAYTGDLIEVSYGWKNIRSILEPTE